MTNEQKCKIAEEEALQEIQIQHGFIFGLYNQKEEPEAEDEDNYEGAPAGSFIICVVSLKYSILQSVNIVADLVGFNFYKVREVWVKIHDSDYYQSPALTDWVKKNSSGGLIYARPDDYDHTKPFYKRITNINGSRFKTDLINLVDLLARTDEQ